MNARDHSSALGWYMPSTCGGDAGIAFLAAVLDACFPRQGWDATAHTYLARAVEACGYQLPGVGLASGVAGLAFTASFASQHGKHYAGLRKDLDQHLARRIDAFLYSVRQRSTLSVAAYDLISGATGIATYLISQRKLTAADSSLADTCRNVLMYLVSLTRPDDNGWYCFIVPENIAQPARRNRYPHGYIDCGLAHGVAGIISVLSLAMANGWIVSGIEKGVSSLAHWLAAQTIQDEYGINWPSMMAPMMPKEELPSEAARPSWCYGIPGIARALYLAGQALDDDGLRMIAVDAFESIAVRPRRLWGIASPNFCHGLSGILQASLRMYHDTSSKRLLVFIQTLADELLALYDPDSLFGFQDMNMQGIWYDNPRLLEGAPGIALVLLALSQPVSPDWDRYFLLS